MKDKEEAEPIHLSVVDDHPIIFLGVQLALKRIKNHRIVFVNQYVTGSEVIDNLMQLQSGVLLIDLCLPDMKGYDLALKILAVYPEMKIGIYSSMLDKEYIVNSFQNGVLGYLPKTAKANEIIDFILTIGRGERYIRGIVADILFENENALQKQPEISITRRETEIIQLIFDGNKNREIAEKLTIAERTVEFHKQNIYAKLEVNNTIDLYKAAMRLNLLPDRNELN